MDNKLNEHYLQKELYEFIKTDSTFFNFIQEGSLDGIWYWNLENIQDEWMSSKFWEVLGYDPKEKEHKSSEWQDIIFEDDLKQATKNLELHFKDPKQLYDQIVRYKHKNGSTVWIRCRGIAIRDSSGRPTRMLGAHTNITDLKEKEKALIESEKRFKILHNASFGGITVHDQGLIMDCNQGLADITGYSIEELIGMNGLLLIAPEYRDFVTHQIQTGYEKPYEVLGIRKNSEVYPLKLEARNIPYEGKQVRVAEFRDITELRHQEKERIDSEKKYRILYETMAQGVVYHDSEGYITSCNPSAEKIVGLSLSQMQGKTATDPIWKMIDEQGNAIAGKDHPDMIALRTKKTVGPVVCGIYHPENDTYVWLNMIAIPLFAEGDDKPYQVYTTFEDITEKRKADLEATYRKELLQYIIGHSNQGIAVHDKDLNYVYVSQRYCDMYHIDKDIIGKHHYEVFPELPQKWKDVHQRSLKGETISGDRDDITRLDGTIQYTRWLSQPWYDVNGEIAGIIIYTEVIDELVDAEIQLQKTVDQLQLVMESLPIGISVTSVNPKLEFKYMNDNFARIYGTTQKAFEKPDSFWSAVYEEPIFREKIKRRVLKDIASGDSKRMVWEDIPITRKNATTRYINAYATPIPNSNQVISTVIDVTDRKQKEMDIVYASNYDFLTRLPNRKYFEERLKVLDKKKYYPLVIAMVDFDGLKLINDAYGRDIGDESLIKISSVLISSIRKDDFLARIGGDEFVILCPNTTLNTFETIKDKIFRKIKNIGYKEMKFSISIGQDVKSITSSNTNDVLKNAENSMFSNKTLHGQSARNETIMTLFETLKEKYDEEKLHSDRVSQFCKQMGEKLKLSQDQIKELEFAGLMHDIGKITIPDKILDKPGKLTDEEWIVMKKHTINGYHILRSADKYSRLAEYALTHHERWDGKGYPNGLRGENIPLFSRIISISDAYEAMTADRPYRKALDQKIAVEELYRCAGSQFDEKLVSVFINEVLNYSESIQNDDI